MAINELIEGYVSRQEAKEQGLKFYFTGLFCKNGHVADRYTISAQCIECKELLAKSEKAKLTAKTYSKSEKGKLRAKKFNQSEKAQIYRKQFRSKPEQIEKTKLYNATEKAKEARKKSAARPEAKRLKLEKQLDKLHNDIQCWLQFILRARLRVAVKNNYKSGSAVFDLGCTIEFLKTYISRQFQIGMTWENRGRVWHIDHIKPLCSFDLTLREQLLEACHYTNLQPLFEKDNLTKSSEDKKKSINKPNANYSCIEAMDLLKDV